MVFLGLASSAAGIDSISIDMKEKKLTVIGTADPVNVVIKLRKHWHTDIITVGPVKEPEKKEEEQTKKEAPKEESKKEEQPQEQEKPAEEPKKEEEPKKDEPKKQEEEEQQPKKKPQPLALPPPDPVLELVRAYRAYNPQMTTHYYVQSMEENPNACVVC